MGNRDEKRPQKKLADARWLATLVAFHRRSEGAGKRFVQIIGGVLLGAVAVYVGLTLLRVGVPLWRAGAHWNLVLGSVTRLLGAQIGTLFSAVLTLIGRWWTRAIILFVAALLLKWGWKAFWHVIHGLYGPEKPQPLTGSGGMQGEQPYGPANPVAAPGETARKAQEHRRGFGQGDNR